MGYIKKLAAEPERFDYGYNKNNETIGGKSTIK